MATLGHRNMDMFKSCIVCLITTACLCFGGTWAREYCGRLHGHEFYCSEGRCCGDFDCCTYYKYYKAWWFWLVWGLITILACCCAYHRRRYYAYHGRIGNFIHPALLGRSSESSTPYQELVVDPKYKLPSYAEVEAMGSLGPPVDVAGAPPPYVDPLATEEQEDDAVNSHSNETFLDGSTDHEDLGSSQVLAFEDWPSENL